MSWKHLFFQKEKENLALQTKDAFDLYLIKRQRSREVREWDLVQTFLRLISPEHRKSEPEHHHRYSPGGRRPRPTAALMFHFFPPTLSLILIPLCVAEPRASLMKTLTRGCRSMAVDPGCLIWSPTCITALGGLILGGC